MLLCSRIFTSVIDLFIVFICRKCFTHSFLLQVNFMSSIIQTNSLFCIYYIYKYSSLICILNLFTVIKVCLSLHCITITQSAGWSVLVAGCKLPVLHYSRVFLHCNQNALFLRDVILTTFIFYFCGIYYTFLFL